MGKDDEKITLKHALLNAAWSAKGKGLDNEYAVAYQAVREVFDREILPLFKAKDQPPQSMTKLKNIAVAFYNVCPVPDFTDQNKWMVYCETLAEIALDMVGAGEASARSQLSTPTETCEPNRQGEVIQAELLAALEAMIEEYQADKEVLPAYFQALDAIKKAKGKTL